MKQEHDQGMSRSPGVGSQRAGGQDGQRSTIEWSEIQRRIELGREILEKVFEPSPEEKGNILKARARALAREAEKIEEAGKCLEVVGFLLAHEKYALELTHIREVYPLKDLTPLPGTPAFVLGIINVRGQILSIIDLKKLFELPEQRLTDLSQIIILHSDEMEFGILADEILDVQSIPLKDIQAPLPTLTGTRVKYLKGVTAEPVVVLNGEKILSDESIVVHKETKA